MYKDGLTNGTINPNHIKPCCCPDKQGKCGGLLSVKKTKRLIENFILGVMKDEKKLGGSIASKLYQKAANLYRSIYYPTSRKLLEYELHPYGANYLGPGTRVDLDYVRNYPPSSPVDDCARTHDIEYYNIKRSNRSPEDKARAIQDSDIKAIDCFTRRYNTDPQLAKLGLAGITGKITIDKLLSLIKGKPTVIYGSGKKSRKYERCVKKVKKSLKKYKRKGWAICNKNQKKPVKKRRNSSRGPINRSPKVAMYKKYRKLKISAIDRSSKSRMRSKYRKKLRK